MKQQGPLPRLIGATLVIAVVCTLFVRDGWLVWPPVLAALFVVFVLANARPGR